MQKSTTTVLAALVLAAAMSTAQARSAVPLIEPQRIVLATAQKPLPIDVVLKSIIKGSAGYRWIVVTQTPEKVTLRYARGDHEAVIDVVYDTTGFQVHYVSSVNLQYAGDGASAEIHPNYNKWVESLNQAIALEASRLVGR